MAWLVSRWKGGCCSVTPMSSKKIANCLNMIPCYICTKIGEILGWNEQTDCRTVDLFLGGLGG
jgi:hypothetical protein